MKRKLTRFLEKSTDALTIWAGVAAFFSYFGMYMYRKPFTAGTFEQFVGLGLDYKSLLVISQVFGYAISKLIGVKLISQMHAKQRPIYYISCILFSELCLILFGWFPFPYGWIFLAMSALPLGLIWGIVFQYLEGRRITEILTVILSANFILASGIAKSLGTWCITLGISETSMPAVIGFLSIPICLVTIWMLEQMPKVSLQDIQLRQIRPQMNNSDRLIILKSYSFLIVLFAIMYILLTVVRDIRDNFGIEIWNALGFKQATELYTFSELVITLFILVCLGILYKIINNFRALKIQIIMIGVSTTALIFSTMGFMFNMLPPIMWMMISGIGLFIPYILFNGMLFDRLIATFKMNANVGFFMYIVDTLGYFFSVLIIIWKSESDFSWSWLNFYMALCVFGGTFLLIALIPLWNEISGKHKRCTLQYEQAMNL